MSAFKGYSEQELRAAFDLVCDPYDWRKPVDHTFPAYMRPVVEAAVAFFTATEATFEEVPGKPKRLRCKAVGYRNGPAGP